MSSILLFTMALIRQNEEELYNSDLLIYCKILFQYYMQFPVACKLLKRISSYYGVKQFVLPIALAQECFQTSPSNFEFWVLTNVQVERIWADTLYWRYLLKKISSYQSRGLFFCRLINPQIFWGRQINQQESQFCIPVQKDLFHKAQEVVLTNQARKKNIRLSLQQKQLNQYILAQKQNQVSQQYIQKAQQSSQAEGQSYSDQFNLIQPHLLSSSCQDISFQSQNETSAQERLLQNSVNGSNSQQQSYDSQNEDELTDPERFLSRSIRHPIPVFQQAEQLKAQATRQVLGMGNVAKRKISGITSKSFFLVYEFIKNGAPSLRSFALFVYFTLKPANFLITVEFKVNYKIFYVLANYVVPRGLDLDLINHDKQVRIHCEATQNPQSFAFQMRINGAQACLDLSFDSLPQEQPVEKIIRQLNEKQLANL